MHQDIRAGKRTEIQSINGAVARLGREHGLAAPVNETLTRLVKIIEHRHQQEASHG
jgi:2-dehydropantoate 2-reductase